MATNILSVLGVDSLALRGYQTEYNRFSRFFKSEQEAHALAVKLETISLSLVSPTW